MNPSRRGFLRGLKAAPVVAVAGPAAALGLVPLKVWADGKHDDTLALQQMANRAGKEFILQGGDYRFTALNIKGVPRVIIDSNIFRFENGTGHEAISIENAEELLVCHNLIEGADSGIAIKS